MKKKFITLTNYNILSGNGHFNRCKILINKLSKKNDRYFFTTEKISFPQEVKKIYNNVKIFKNYKEAFNRCLSLSKLYNLVLNKKNRRKNKQLKSQRNYIPYFKLYYKQTNIFRSH